MKRILFIAILILMIASPVMAQSQTYFHEVTVELDGEWEFNSEFAAPDIVGGVSLSGIGQARIHAITKSQSVPTWWQLF
jgi:hypothetical protein